MGLVMWSYYLSGHLSIRGKVNSRPGAHTTQSLTSTQPAVRGTMELCVAPSQHTHLACSFGLHAPDAIILEQTERGANCFFVFASLQSSMSRRRGALTICTQELLPSGRLNQICISVAHKYVHAKARAACPRATMETSV